MIEQPNSETTSPEEIRPAAPASAEAPKPVVRRVIDPGGDGQRAQIFEAEDLEDLVDQLARSTLHGTLHIRTLESENRDLREETEKLRAQSEVSPINAFLVEHPDYENSKKNGRLMRLQLAEMGLPATSEGLDKAYSALKQHELLTPKRESKEPEPARVEQQRTDVARPRRTSSIGTHSRATAVPVSTEPSESELYRMPIDELKDLANKQLRTPSSVT